jgi:hypothetical protein
MDASRSLSVKVGSGSTFSSMPTVLSIPARGSHFVTAWKGLLHRP